MQAALAAAAVKVEAAASNATTAAVQRKRSHAKEKGTVVPVSSTGMVTKKARSQAGGTPTTRDVQRTVAPEASSAPKGHRPKKRVRSSINAADVVESGAGRADVEEDLDMGQAGRLLGKHWLLQHNSSDDAGDGTEEGARPPPQPLLPLPPRIGCSGAGAEAPAVEFGVAATAEGAFASSPFLRACQCCKGGYAPQKEHKKLGSWPVWDDGYFSSHSDEEGAREPPLPARASSSASPSFSSSSSSSSSSSLSTVGGLDGSIGFSCADAAEHAQGAGGSTGRERSTRRTAMRESAAAAALLKTPLSILAVTDPHVMVRPEPYAVPLPTLQERLLALPKPPVFPEGTTNKAGSASIARVALPATHVQPFAVEVGTAAVPSPISALCHPNAGNYQGLKHV